MEKIKYGIIGIGKMGSLHARKLKVGLIRNSALGAVCDNDPKRLEWAKKTLKDTPAFDNYKQLIDSGLVDAVLIATPHYLHPPIAKYAISKGIHTIIEKPAGVFTKDVRELNEFAASRPDIAFGIMYNQRTNKLYRKAKEIMDSGQMGELKRASWLITDWYRPQAYYDQGGWRGTWSGEGGGVLINQCPHQLDLFQWLVGMPKKVRGYVKEAVHRDINVENDVTAYLEYENGATGLFVTSTHDSPGTNRLEISSNGGKIVIEKNKLEYYKLNQSEQEFNAVNTKFMPRIPYTKKVVRIGKLASLLELVFGQHTKIVKNFSEHLLSKEPLIAPGADGIDGLTLSNAIHLSSWLNKEIELPIDENSFIEQLELKKKSDKEQVKLES